MSSCEFRLLAREVTLKIIQNLLCWTRCGDLKPSHWRGRRTVPVPEDRWPREQERVELAGDPVTFASGSLPMRKENVHPHKNLYVTVRKSSVQNSQQVQTTQVSTSSHVVPRSAVCPCSGTPRQPETQEEQAPPHRRTPRTLCHLEKPDNKVPRLCVFVYANHPE